MLVGMASKISKYTYKYVDHSRQNRIKEAKAKCTYVLIKS